MVTLNVNMSQSVLLQLDKLEGQGSVKMNKDKGSNFQNVLLVLEKVQMVFMGFWTVYYVCVYCMCNVFNLCDPREISNHG